MALTDTVIRTAKPRDKPYKMADEKGMFLYITPRGGKLWRLKYRFNGKEKLLSLGAYPDVSLKDARASRDEARKLHANKIDPSKIAKYKRPQEWHGQQTVSRLLPGNGFPSTGLDGQPVILRGLSDG